MVPLSFLTLMLYVFSISIARALPILLTFLKIQLLTLLIFLYFYIKIILYKIDFLQLTLGLTCSLSSFLQSLDH